MPVMCLLIQLHFEEGGGGLVCTLKASCSHSTIGQFGTTWILGAHPSPGSLFILTNYQQPNAIAALKGTVATFIKDPAFMFQRGLFPSPNEIPPI